LWLGEPGMLLLLLLLLLPLRWRQGLLLNFP
jgi:hypothetical protein